jgi:hypothetical protein
MPCCEAARTWPVTPGPIGTTTIASGFWEASCWMLSTCLVASPLADAYSTFTPFCPAWYLKASSLVSAHEFVGPCAARATR